MKALALILAAFLCLPMVSALGEGPITLGKTTPAWIPPPKNPQDCDMLFNSGDYEKAIQCYNNTTALIPDDAKAWFNKGSALLELNRTNEALQCFEKVIQLQPSRVEGWNNKGLSLAMQGNYEEAIRCYDVAIQLDPQAPQPWVNKARALAMLGQYDEALKCCNTALQLDPTDGTTIYFRNLLLEHLGSSYNSQNLEASQINVINISSSLNASNQENIPLWKEWGYSSEDDFLDQKASGGIHRYSGAYLTECSAKYMLKQQWGKAIKCYDFIIEKNPVYDQAWSEKGLALYYLSRYEEALNCFNKSIELDPSNGAYWRNKGATLSRLHRDSEADAAFDKAYSLVPIWNRTRDRDPAFSIDPWD